MWAKLPDTANTPVDVSLQLLAALHARWVSLLRGMDSSDFARTLRHPEIGVLDLNRMLALRLAFRAPHGARHIATQTHGLGLGIKS